MNIPKMNFDKIFKSKEYEQTTKYLFVMFWLISGSMFIFVPENTNPHAQFVFGFIFGIFFVSAINMIGEELIKIGEYVGNNL